MVSQARHREGEVPAEPRAAARREARPPNTKSRSNRHPDGSVERPEGSRAGVTRHTFPGSLLAALVSMTGFARPDTRGLVQTKTEPVGQGNAKTPARRGRAGE